MPPGAAPGQARFGTEIASGNPGRTASTPSARTGAGSRRTRDPGPGAGTDTKRAGNSRHARTRGGACSERGADDTAESTRRGFLVRPGTVLDVQQAR